MMKQIRLLLAILLLLPISLHAQEDAKYLTGAVPEENGKVVFKTQIEVNRSKAEIYATMKQWAESLAQRQECIDHKTRIAYENEEKGELAVAAEEYIVFSNSGISLDRTRIYYNIRILCDNQQCKIYMMNIKYLYDENRNGGTRYTAEEIITDKECLTKDKTKLYKTIGKFRRKTVDLKDELIKSASQAFGVQTLTEAKIIEAKTVASTVDLPKQEEAPKVEKKMSEEPQKATKAKSVESVKPTETAKPVEPQAVMATPTTDPMVGHNSSEIAKETFSITTQKGSKLYELLEKTGKATLTFVSENGTAAVLLFQKTGKSYSTDKKTCTFVGELSK